MINLYRHWDKNDKLLYVGISLNAVARLSQHRNKRWFGEIAKVTVEKCPTREAALEAETKAIETEDPINNASRAEMMFLYQISPCYKEYREIMAKEKPRDNLGKTFAIATPEGNYCYECTFIPNEKKLYGLEANQVFMDEAV